MGNRELAFSVCTKNNHSSEAEALFVGSNHDVVNTEIAAGVVSLGDKILYPHAYDAMMRLRGRRYLTKGYLNDSDVEIDDYSVREKPDQYDSQSIGFAIVKGSLVQPHPIAIACYRLVLKENTSKLPVEHHFNIDTIKPGNGLEISRFINDPENLPSITIVAMISSAIGLMVRMRREGFGVLERPLVRLASGFGVSFEQLSECKVLEQYGPKPNLAVKISPIKTVENLMNSDDIKKQAFGKLCLQASRSIDSHFADQVKDIVRGKK